MSSWPRLRMSKLILLYLTFVLGLYYLVIPNTVEPRDYFLFSDMQLYLSTHIYFIIEKFILIVLAYILANEATEYKQALWVFFWLLVVDLVDYTLAYGSVWFSIGQFPVSMNMVKVFVFGSVILKEWSQKLLTK